MRPWSNWPRPRCDDVDHHHHHHDCDCDPVGNLAIVHRKVYVVSLAGIDYCPVAATRLVRAIPQSRRYPTGDRFRSGRAVVPLDVRPVVPVAWYPTAFVLQYSNWAVGVPGSEWRDRVVGWWETGSS